MLKKLSAVGLLVSVITLAVSGTASAHVVVRPAEAVTAGFQTFIVGVPNEKEIPTTSVRLDIPAGLQFISPTQKAGWQIDIQKEGEGEAATVQSLTWRGGQVNAGFREEFTFSAKVPEEAAALNWKAYQTYQDGTVVAWDQAPDPSKEDDHGFTPYSVTQVVDETEASVAVREADQAAADAKQAAETAKILGIAGVVVGLAGIYLATRKSSR